MATKPQLALIHIGKASLRLNDGDYRGIMQQMFGVRSARDLDDKQAGEFIEWFEKQGFELKKQPKLSAATRRPRTSSPVRGPSDGKETINKKQQECIDAFRRYLKWDEKRMMQHSKKIVKEWWPQNRAQGVALIINLIAVNAKMILRNIRVLDQTQLTDWKKEFLYLNKKADGKIENALDQFGLYVANKNKRGKRTMPDCSMLKLLEILRKRPIKFQALTTDIPHSGHES